jgi:DNA-binding phage protein
MRVGVVRSDIGHMYLQDVENRSQRNFSSQPAGQSRYFHKPTDVEIQAFLDANAPLTKLGSVTTDPVDTTGTGNKLNVKASASASVFTQITVTSGATTSKAQIVSDLNSGFLAAGLPLVASLQGTAQVAINTTLKGENAYLELSAGSPSTATLQTVLGLATTALTPLTVAALKTAVYPSATTINVASATIVALSSFASLSTSAQATLVGAVQDFIAPSLVETGPTLMSFVYGNLSKWRSSAFQPGGTRIGLPAGIAAAIVANDGSTPFTV